MEVSEYKKLWKGRYLILSSLIYLLTPHSFGADRGEGIIHLEELIQEALSRNPSVKAAKLMEKEHLDRVPQARSLPDPMLSLGASNIPVTRWDLDSTPMSGINIGIMQAFPFPGKLRISGEAAYKRALKSRDLFEERKNRIRWEVAEAYFRLSYAMEALEILETNRDLMVNFVKIAEERYRVGKGNLSDLLQGEVELEKIDDSIYALEKEREVLFLRLTELVGGRRIKGRTEKLDFSEISLDQGRIVEMALKENPRLSALKREAEASYQDYLLAKKGYLPDFQLGTVYRIREYHPMDAVEGEDFFSIQFGMNLPIYSKTKQSKRIAETFSAWKRKEEEWKDLKNTITRETGSVIEEISFLHKEYLLFRDEIIPRIEASLESSLSLYRVGRVDFLTLIHDFIGLYNHEIKLKGIMAGHDMMIFKLEWLVGEKITKISRR